ncbi:sporulation protein YqfD [Inediibacterium massiliense]|uniref:sporulation protein YqfD n=1 Tax=Inediibacterium massiliense TaxID=1658111 RepID=UPI0006B56F37|nr:sporulation protein YqfD [Inediibacterium massiliense]
MLAIKLWNILRGYVVIRIEGLSLEKFINYAIAKGIYFWDIIRIDYTTLEAKVGINGYKELRHIVKRTGCKVKINQKIGYPFFMHRMKERKMFITGFIFCIFMVFMMTSFIWNIEIVGNEKNSENDIIKYLDTLGLYEGALKYKLNLSDIENNMMIKLDHLTWVGIHIQGTKAIVEIVEGIDPPKIIPKNIPCDLVAKKKGVIEKVIARNGDALVQRGDIVKKGQRLITGQIQREEIDTRYVHALGEIFARTYYEKEDEISLSEIKKIKTGKKFTRRIAKIGNNQIILSLEEIPYKNVIIERRNKRLLNWRNIQIPVEFITEDYYEVIQKKETINESIAKDALVEKMTVDLVKNIPQNASILNQDIVFSKKGNKIKGKLIIEVLEEIGEQQKITPHIELKEDL